MNQDNRRKFFHSGDNGPFRLLLAGCAFLLVMALVFSAGSGVGFAIGRMSTGGFLAQTGLPVGSAGEFVEEERELNENDLDIFWEAMDLLEQDFYGDLPTQQDRSYGAIRGVLDLLEDPNTSFLTPDQAQLFLERMGGSFEGIGATVEWVEEQEAVRIVEPFENQPAWRAGLRRGDLIIEIDGQDVAEMDNLIAAVNQIRGPEGTTVRLTVLRKDEVEPFEVEVTRDVIQVPVVSSEMMGEEENIAYVSLNQFSDNVGDKLEKALEEVLANDPEGLILDLRGNPGGLLREAVRVTSLFLPDDEVVLIERFSDGTEDIYRTEGGPVVLADLPIVVLVDEGSASASEIVSGALQDAGRAVLIGTTTFGKGSVQLPHHLSDGSLMRVTIARWYTPKDRSIDGTGLEPDIVIEISEEEFEAEQDPQLDRALQLLESGQ